jgi:hypothetical protein
MVFPVMSITKLIRFFGTAAALLALVWFVNQVVRSAADFPSFDFRELMYIISFTFIYAVPALLAGIVWCYLMRVVGESQARPLEAMSINCLSQAGKYLPGNVAHYFGRILLARQAGWGGTNTLYTIFIETLWSVAVAALLALVAVIYAQEQLFLGMDGVPRWQVLAVLALFAVLAPALGHRVFALAAELWARHKGISASSLQAPPIRAFWIVISAYIFSYLVMGWVLSLIASQVFGVSPGPVVLFAGIYAVAWVTGFVTPGAPAGLGIREVILVAALTPLYDTNIATGIAAALRVVTILGDCLVVIIGLGLKQFISKPAGE